MHPPSRLAAACLSFAALATSPLHAAPEAPEIKVTKGYDKGDVAFKFPGFPGIANNDAATKATFKVVSGQADSNGGGLGVLHDGLFPTNNDEPERNVFFTGKGGRLSVDLGAVIDVKNVATYSWHSGARAPQVYKLYAADGKADKFDPAPTAATDPASVGWTLVAALDTKPDGGGQHGVSIGTTGGAPIGSYRYLLFDIASNSDDNANTFFSEIDVTDAKGPALTFYEKKLDTFHSKDGKFTFTLDSTEAPDLAKWCAEKLIPVIEVWYPKILEMIPVEDFKPADTIHFTLRNDTSDAGEGVPAYASGDGIALNAGFMRENATGEAIGCAIHEIVHIAQGNQQDEGTTGPPTWVTEGVADYIRWFIYEPQSKGAEITAEDVDSARYDASYRTTANFFDWVVRTHDKDLIRKLNLTGHKGYSDDLWKEWTGKSARKLGAEWKAANKERLGVK